MVAAVPGGGGTFPWVMLFHSGSSRTRGVCVCVPSLGGLPGGSLNPGSGFTQ